MRNEKCLHTVKKFLFNGVAVTTDILFSYKLYKIKEKNYNERCKIYKKNVHYYNKKIIRIFIYLK
jgi:hypothetical protein